MNPEREPFKLRVVSEQESKEARALRIEAPVDLGDADLLYANFVQATTTPHDLTLHFGWYMTPPFVEPPEGADLVVPVKSLAKVSIPLTLVRGVMRVLQAQIDSWPEVYGEEFPTEASPKAELIERATKEVDQ